MKKLFLKRYIRNGIFVIVGIFMGWLFFHSPGKIEKISPKIEKSSKATIWTCAMHPQIRKSEPGNCPICGMELIKLDQDTFSAIDSDAIQLTKEAEQLANVETSIVTHHSPIKEVRLYGKVQADERLLQSQVAQIPGRIEKLMVNFTGEKVQKGQTLAIVYSPELITAQQELLESAKMKDSQPEIYMAAINRLNEWKLSDKQIEEIESSGMVKNNFEILSNTTGVVTARRVNNGDYISRGTVLYEIANLSHVWIMFDAYESDLPFLAIGDKLTFDLQALPGLSFKGEIRFIDPVLDPVTRVAKVRVEVSNESGRLKPEMFVTGTVEADMEQYQNSMIIPRSAVLWTGKRSVVYVKQAGSDEAVFKIREVELGPMLKNSYIVTDGLKEGEEIVTHGTFSVDAAAQLEGKPSMMNKKTEKTVNMPEKTLSKNSDLKTNSKTFIITNPVQTVNFHVSGNCDLCKARIDSAATSVKGVISADWDINTKNIRLVYSIKQTNLSMIHAAIAGSGHDNGNYTASSAAYGKLPVCCKYRDLKK